MAKLTVETGHYLITAQLPTSTIWQQQTIMPALLLRDEYEGWLQFHCTFRGGAMSLNLKREQGRWHCQNARWRVTQVQMVTRGEYLAALATITQKCLKKKVNKIVAFSPGSRRRLTAGE